ncbi:hypothetical protein GOP47_0024911 [Adiantum capillus-veneris]|uniref:Protein NBR1 homolog n=1 Tax=Adiantum capillus-veneris TaxID=13818 RepID=A0A9D4Z5H1_ADICA|nr:hypothetical protein GOP47_0024911 [Adiantum capillus-veneris]
MALVFKIKHKETLRRWVVLQTFPEKSSDLSLTVHDLELKVRELFHLASNDVLLITYVDKEGDIVTLADDQDLVDACFLQGLNPLRLEVKTLEHEAPVANNPASAVLRDGVNSADAASPLPNLNDKANPERTSRPPFPQAAADDIKQFLSKCAQNIDPNLQRALLIKNIQNLQPAVVIKNIEKALKDLVKRIVHEGQRLAPRSAAPSSESPAYTPCASQPPESSSSMDNGNQIVHFGVRCDGCKLHPIQGLRYKSTKVFNYDLCSSCFNKMGNDSDYQKIEKSTSLPCNSFFHSSPANGKGNGVPAKWTSPFASGSDGWKSECPFLRTLAGPPGDISKKYDASFLKDVSVFDELELGPCTQFTRTLRLNNTGSMSWPQGTQLIHIGGDKLASEPAVFLKLPEGGLSMGLEFDVSVDMRAPEKAGNYISHWCLMAPNGEKFGQSVWIAIHVVGEMKEQYEAQVASGRDEMAQKAEEMNEHEEIKQQSKVECAQISKVDDSSLVGQKSIGLESFKADEGSPAESAQFIVSGFTNHDVGSCMDEVDGFSVIEKPEDMESFKRVQTPLVSSQLASPQTVSVIDEQYGRMSPMEIANQETKLRELELMGFKNRNLNAILLEKNSQDLQLTLDDLLLGSGWVNLLEDLQEMGFDDANTNLRLLIKHEGSIKRVVKELVELEKGESGLVL